MNKNKNQFDNNGVKDRGKGQGYVAEAIFDARTRPIVVVKFCHDELQPL